MDDSEDIWLPLKPSEPLPSQCCGSGCKPCIYDIYQKDLEKWEEAKAKKDISLLSRKEQQSSNSDLTQETFMAFNISSVTQLTEDTYQYTFELPGNSSLGLSLGQHIVLSHFLAFKMAALKSISTNEYRQHRDRNFDFHNSVDQTTIYITDVSLQDKFCYSELFPTLSFHINILEKHGDTARKSEEISGMIMKPRGIVNGLEVQRAYTPITPVNAEGYFEVLIKCYKAGLMSQYIKSWKTGDAIFWRGPFGGFPYSANQYGELLMLASGTGIAPMLPIIQYVTKNEDDETFVTLVGCFRTFENIYMKALLQEQSRFWNIRTFYVLSQEHSLKNLPWSFQGTTHLGRINENLIKSMVNMCRRQPFVLICGSVTFNKDMEKCLKAIGFEEESYFIF